MQFVLRTPLSAAQLMVATNPPVTLHRSTSTNQLTVDAAADDLRLFGVYEWLW